MSSLTIALFAFACIFVSAMVGLSLREFLPERHIDNDSRDTVRLAMGLIATLSALVLGLLTATAKGSFDRINNEIILSAANVAQLDRILAQYGPETGEVRDLLKRSYSTAAELLGSGDESKFEKLKAHERVIQLEAFQAKIRALSPKDDAQRELRARAVQLSGELANLRWLVMVQLSSGLPMPLLIVLVLWVSIIFAGWGLFAPRTPTVTVALLACALCVSGAIFLILEMDQPLSGFIRISSAPMREAISHLGQ